MRLNNTKNLIKKYTNKKRQREKYRTDNNEIEFGNKIDGIQICQNIKTNNKKYN